MTKPLATPLSGAELRRPYLAMATLAVAPAAAIAAPVDAAKVLGAQRGGAGAASADATDDASAAAPAAPARTRATDLALQLGPGTIWGASFLFIAEGLGSTGPAGVAFLRIFIGAATLALLPAARRPLPRAAWPQVGLLAVVWFALPLSLFPLAEEHVSSALTGMLNGGVPIFAALIGALLARRPPTRRMTAGLAVGFTGAVMVALPTLHEGRSSATGVLLILVALVSYGVAVHVARPLQQRYGSLPVIARALGVAALLTAPLGVTQVAHARWSLVPALSLLALGMLGTGLAFAVAATAVGRLGPSRAAATAFVIPGVALALGVLLHGEHVGAVPVAGAAVSLAGVWLLRRATER